MNKKEYPVSGILAAGLLIAALLGVMGIFYQNLQEKLFTQAVNNLVVNTQSDKLYFDQIIQNRLYWLERSLKSAMFRTRKDRKTGRRS
mgnify:CR=1 FL=1